MAAITWKCPNCGGELVFEPSLQKYQCPYCTSVFTQQELEEIAPDQASEQTAAWQEETTQEQDQAARPEAVVYSCPSCGAELITDSTTAATFCYYCHNPVVLEGRLSGDFLPDKIIPFQISREKAEKEFGNYIGKKRFVPRAFYRKEQIEKLTGVYYPYWCYEAEVASDVAGEGTKVRVWRSGDTEFTETSKYQIERRGTVGLRNMTAHALQKSDRLLVENVQPFRLEEQVDFSMTYLSGFVAEKRDMDSSQFMPSMQEKAREYARARVRETISGYTASRYDRENFRIAREKWSYLLLPVWVLTYRDAGGKMYSFAMNGQTGNICGILPVDKGKLGLWSAAVGAAVGVLGLLAGYFLI